MGRVLAGESSVGETQPDSPTAANDAVLAVTPSRLAELRSLDVVEMASTLHRRVQYLDVLSKTTFVELGIICSEMQDNGLWAYIEGCSGFDAWVALAAPYSRSHCYDAMSAVRELQDVPAEALAAVPRCNVKTLQRLSTAVRREPGVLQAAADMTENEFLQKIESEYPQQHMQPKKILRFKLDRDDANRVNEIIQWAIDNGFSNTRETVLVDALEVAYDEWTNEQLAKAAGEMAVARVM